MLVITLASSWSYMYMYVALVERRHSRMTVDIFIHFGPYICATAGPPHLVWIIHNDSLCSGACFSPALVSFQALFCKGHSWLPFILWLQKKEPELYTFFGSKRIHSDAAAPISIFESFLPWISFRWPLARIDCFVSWNKTILLLFLLLHKKHVLFYRPLPKENCFYWQPTFCYVRACIIHNV
jgi:hypothetical protein